MFLHNCISSILDMMYLFISSDNSIKKYFIPNNAFLYTIFELA